MPILFNSDQFMQPYNTFVIRDKWSLREFRTLAQIESIRELWRSFQQNQEHPALQSDIDRYLSVWRASESRWEPCVLLLCDDDVPKTLIIARIGREPLRIKLWSKVLFRPQLKKLSIAYGGVLNCSDKATSKILLTALKSFMHHYRLDCIHFDHLKSETVIYQESHNTFNMLCRTHFPKIEPHWRMSIPSNVDEFYTKLSKKHRANLKRDQKKLESQYKERLHIIHYRKNCNLEKMFHDAVVVSEKTYQHPLGVGFYDNPLLQSIIAKDIEKGRLFLSIMYLRNQPVSFQWGTIYRGTYFLEKLGYDPHYASWNVGSVLFLKVLDELCSDPKALQLDFGFGDAEYKQSYGDESWQEAAATYLFAPRVYPILINLVITVNSIFTLGLMWTVKKCGIYGWLKRKWRRKLYEKIENQR